MHYVIITTTSLSSPRLYWLPVVIIIVPLKTRRVCCRHSNLTLLTLKLIIPPTQRKSSKLHATKTYLLVISSTCTSYHLYLRGNYAPYRIPINSGVIGQDNEFVTTCSLEQLPDWWTFAASVLKFLHGIFILLSGIHIQLGNVSCNVYSAL